ncbi:unnamed protein product [Moneuplotes crassus]|uniref:Uncharacterized protein n=1 Tax=Euplotes crassus TaxID=5936 RepID=A0AAD1U7X8_EUPCR|nr:unnamed protein product [Moneuplotes crassus]
MGSTAGNSRITLSICCNILPFYGKYRTWSKLLIQLCKRSKLAFEKYKKELTTLNECVVWRSDKYEIEVLLKKIYKTDLFVDKPPIFHLRGYEEQDRELIKLIRPYQYPENDNFQVIITDFDAFKAQELKDIIKIVKENIPEEISVFKAKCRNPIESNSLHLSFFRAIIPKVRRKIVIENLLICEQIHDLLLKNPIGCILLFPTSDQPLSPFCSISVKSKHTEFYNSEED